MGTKGGACTELAGTTCCTRVDGGGWYLGLLVLFEGILFEGMLLELLLSGLSHNVQWWKSSEHDLHFTLFLLIQ